MLIAGVGARPSRAPNGTEPVSAHSTADASNHGSSGATRPMRRPG
ncbi:hypothetical protein [Paenibacillus silvae]|nr:hypothetical protein [Paenibacillus silvae]